jgi:hypothetical protein
MGAHLRVQVPLRAGHSEQSEAQLREGDRAWEGSVERKSRPHYADSRAMNPNSLPRLLNLGCGFDHCAGWLNVDGFEACKPDRLMDLEQFPWDLPSQSWGGQYDAGSTDAGGL